MSTIVNEEALICEAIIKEIARAQRWTAVVDAWCALLTVRRKAKELRDEQAMHSTDWNEASSNWTLWDYQNRCPNCGVIYKEPRQSYCGCSWLIPEKD